MRIPPPPLLLTHEVIDEKMDGHSFYLSFFPFFFNFCVMYSHEIFSPPFFPSIYWSSNIHGGVPVVFTFVVRYVIFFVLLFSVCLRMFANVYGGVFLSTALRLGTSSGFPVNSAVQAGEDFSCYVVLVWTMQGGNVPFFYTAPLGRRTTRNGWCCGTMDFRGDFTEVSCWQLGVIVCFLLSS